MDKFLEIGDVFELKKGMKVNAQVPEKFFVTNRKLSNDIHSECITVGDVLNYKCNIESDVVKICKDICESFHFRVGIELNNADVVSFVNNIINNNLLEDDNLDTSIFCGEYVVVGTSFEGGGQCHNDYYPDGHHVFAKKLNNGKYDVDGEEINFYQSGCFAAMVKPENVEVIRKMQIIFG